MTHTHKKMPPVARLNRHICSVAVGRHWRFFKRDTIQPQDSMAARPGPVKFGFLKWRSDDPRYEAVEKELQQCLTQEAHKGWRLHLRNIKPCEDSLMRLLRVVPVAEVIIDNCDWVTGKILESLHVRELTHFRLTQYMKLNEWGGDSVPVSNAALARFLKNHSYVHSLSVDVTVLYLDPELQTALSRCKSVDLHILMPKRSR